MEHCFTLMEGVAQRIVLRFETPDGETLPGARYVVAGGAWLPGCLPVTFKVEQREEKRQLTVPGLRAGGLPWLYMVTACDAATGVVWEVLRGEITVEKGVGGICGVAPVEFEASACLNAETMEITVVVGESTASCSVAVEKANTAAEKAEASAVAAREAWNEASAAEDAAEIAQRAAEASAESAEEYAVAAEESARAAAGSATEATAAATEATTAAAGAMASREAAAGSATEATAAATEATTAAAGAMASREVAAGSATEASAAATEATTAAAGAMASREAAAGSATEAMAAATEATTAAAAATAAAEAAREPGSIAAQAARPAVMLLLRGYCEGYGGQFTVDVLNEAIVVHTDRWSEGDFAEVEAYCGRVVPAFMEWVAYNHNMEVSAADINKYAECKTYADVVAVNADYLKDLTSEGEWVYPMPNMTRFENNPNGDWWAGFFFKSSIKKIKAVFPKCTYCHAFFGGASNIEEADLEFPVATRVSAPARSIYKLSKLRLIAPEATDSNQAFYWNQCRNQDWYIYYPKTKNMSGMFSSCIYLQEIKGEFGKLATNLDSAYNKCAMLRVFPTDYPVASTADGMFNECQIPKEAALAVINSLPVYESGTHKITLGIHVDYQHDEELLAAIALLDIAQTPVAEGGKGWAVVVQWNGTATAAAASWGLRRMPVYAKVREVTLPDGKTAAELDWGHYVTNWEANGYAEFGSVEEAREFFGIVAEDAPAE